MDDHELISIINEVNCRIHELEEDIVNLTELVTDFYCYLELIGKNNDND